MGLAVRPALTAAAALLLAGSAIGAIAATPVDVALSKLDALEERVDGAELSERQRIARTALEIAGPDALAPVAARLSSGGMRCMAAAWALGESSPDGDEAPSAVVAALRRSARSGDWDCRLASASALGRLSIAAGAPEVLAAWSDPWRPPGTDGVALLAVAGCAGDAGDPVLAGFLETGGDPAWARLAIAAALRRGSEAWTILVPAACGHPDPSVRATASLALLLLAEPRAGCALAECAASEPDPGIRRMHYQALATGMSPTGQSLLLLASRVDPDPELRQAAGFLALFPLQAPPRARLTVTTAEVRASLARAVHEPLGPQGLGDVESGASSVDLPALQRTLRLLPLRQDAARIDEHARLAQLRARLLCAADPDCDPPAPRIGRPRGD